MTSTPCSSSTRAEVAPGGGAEAALERVVLEHDHRHAAAQLGQRGGDLGGDVGAADAHDVLGALGLRADAVGVAERAQVVHALELGAVDGQAADHGAGRDQGAVEADLLLGRELGRARRGVELEDARARQQLDAVGLPPVGGVHVRALGAVLAAQVLLGRRRAVVGRMRARARRGGSSPRSPARAACARRSPRRCRRRRGGCRPSGPPCDGPDPTWRSARLRTAGRSAGRARGGRPAGAGRARRRGGRERGARSASGSAARRGCGAGRWRTAAR